MANRRCRSVELQDDAHDDRVVRGLDPHSLFQRRERRLEQWRACVECQQRGLVRSIGVSNFGVSHLKEIEASGLPLPAANQLELHPLARSRAC